MTTFPHVTHVPTTTASNQRVAGVASASGVSSLGLTAIVTNMSLLPPGQDVHSILTIPKQTRETHLANVDSHLRVEMSAKALSLQRSWKVPEVSYT